MLVRLLPALVPLALFVAAGAGLQALLPAPIDRSRAARAGYAYLLGLAWVGLGSWAAGFLFAAPLGRPLFLAAGGVAVAAGAAAVAVRRGRLGGLRGLAGPAAARRRGRIALLPAVALVAVATLALLADTTADPVHDFDGRMTWGTQAKYLRTGRSVLPEVLRDADAFVSHPRYPILMPLLQVASAELSGTSLEGYSVRPLYVLLLPALVAALAPMLRRVGGPRAAGLSILLLFSAPALLWDPDVGPRGTYSDFPLAAFLGSGLLVLLHPRSRREPWRGAAAGLLLAAAAGCKNEGLVLAPLAVGAVLAGEAWAGRRRARRRAAARRRSLGSLAAAIVAGAAVAAALALILAWRSEIPNRYDEGYFEALSPAALFPALAERAPEVARRAAAQSFDPRKWGLVFWAAPLLVTAGAAGLRGRAVRAAAGLLAGQGLLVAAAYAAAVHLGVVAVTWSRFIVQTIVPLAIVLTAAARGALVAARRRPAASVARGPTAPSARRPP